MVRYRLHPRLVPIADLAHLLRCSLPYAARVLRGEQLLDPLTARILAESMGINYSSLHLIATRIDVQAPPSPSDRAASRAAQVLREQHQDVGA